MELHDKIKKSQIVMSDADRIHQSILKALSTSKSIRLISDNMIETEGYNNADIAFLGGIKIGRCHFKENFQVVRYFELNFDDLKVSNETNLSNLDYFLNNIKYMDLFNPLFVCYYGINVSIIEQPVEEGEDFQEPSSYLDTNPLASDRI